MGRTHMMGAGAAAGGASLLVAATANPMWIALGMLGGIIPDIDEEDSRISHMLIAKPFSWLIRKAFTHRGFTHSLLGILAFGALSVPLGIFVNWGWWVAMMIGYVSHIILDACTVQGIEFMFPSVTPYKVPFHKVNTGSAGELAYTLPLLAALAAVVILPASRHSWTLNVDPTTLAMKTWFSQQFTRIEDLISKKVPTLIHQGSTPPHP